jgi:hypothetical protein
MPRLGLTDPPTRFVISAYLATLALSLESKPKMYSQPPTQQILQAASPRKFPEVLRAALMNVSKPCKQRSFLLVPTAASLIMMLSQAAEIMWSTLSPSIIRCANREINFCVTHPKILKL